MLLFEGVYPDLDGYGYFGMAMRDGLDVSQFGFGAGTENIVQLTALLATITGDSYHALKMFYAYAGLVAVFLLYRAAMVLTRGEDLRVLLLAGVFPSLLFWSSTLGKDPIDAGEPGYRATMDGDGDGIACEPYR